MTINIRPTTILFIYAGLLIIGCAGSYTFVLKESDENKMLPGIPLEIRDDDYETVIRRGISDQDGSYSLKVKAIPSDSFYVLIDVDDYFPVDSMYLTHVKVRRDTLLLEKRITTIIGWVVDDSTDQPMQGCTVTMGSGKSKLVTTTDDSGRFIFQSETLMEINPEITFTHDDYFSKQDGVVPEPGQKKELELPIWLMKSPEEDIPQEMWDPILQELIY